MKIAEPSTKKLTVEQKFRVSSSLYATTFKVKYGALKRKNPEWSPDRLDRETRRRLFLLHD